MIRLVDSLKLTLDLMDPLVQVHPREGEIGIWQITRGETGVSVGIRSCFEQSRFADSSIVDISDYNLNQNLPRVAHEIYAQVTR